MITNPALHPSPALPSRQFKPQSRFLRLTTAARLPSGDPTQVTLRPAWSPWPEPASWKIPTIILFDLPVSTTILALHTTLRMATAPNSHKSRVSSSALRFLPFSSITTTTTYSFHSSGHYFLGFRFHAGYAAAASLLHVHLRFPRSYSRLFALCFQLVVIP